jgi:uncharacterized protein Smg (DUF494 family)
MIEWKANNNKFISMKKVNNQENDIEKEIDSTISLLEEAVNSLSSLNHKEMEKIDGILIKIIDGTLPKELNKKIKKLILFLNKYRIILEKKEKINKQLISLKARIENLKK